MASHSRALLFVIIYMTFIVVGTSLAAVNDPGSTDNDLSDYNPTNPGQGASCYVDVSTRKVNCSHRGLTEVPRDIPSNAQDLSLSYNLLQRIRNESFAYLKNLVDISLKYNVICAIEVGAFFELYLLQSVNLVGNRLSVLPSQLFSQNFYMTDIFLRDNDLTDVPDLYLNAPNLSFIDLGENSIKSANFRMHFATECNIMLIDLSDNHIKRIQESDLTNLKVCSNINLIDFSSNDISSIHPHSLQGINVRGIGFGANPLSKKGVVEVFEAAVKAPYVTFINLVKSSLAFLSADIFSPLETYVLKTLSLSENNISSIPDNVFHYLTRLERLYLTSNKISVISPSGFNNLSSLKELYLDGCGIVTLKTPAETGVWEPPLRSLSLGNNYLHEIPSKAFVGLKVLIYLILHFNSIRVIYPDSFDGLASLELLQMEDNLLISPLRFSTISTLITLDLSNSGINSLDPHNTFTDLSSLSELMLNNNYLHISDIWDNEGNISIFRDLRKLKKLDLSANQLQGELPSGCFKGLHSLVQLNLQGMSLPRLNPDLFEGLANLQLLSLDDNALKDLHPKIFHDLGNLFSLFLSRNPISSLDDHLFVHTKKLYMLSLSSTNIDVIKEKTLGPIIPSLSTLDLSSKALSCNCKNKWFRNWIQNSSAEVRLDDTICSSASPKELEGKPFEEFEPALYCGPKIILYSSISVVSVMVIAIMVLFYYNRWWMNYKCFLLKLCIIGYSEIVEDRDYEYDINVVFEDDDEEWVNESLVPNIQEREPEVTLLVGDDMLPLGMYRLDAVAHVIDNSYKSVFIVSQSAIKDSWFLTKLRIALQHVNHAKRDAVLFVFMDDIADEDLPYLIRLQTQGIC